MKIKSKKAEIKRSLSLYALMTPSLILLILFSYLPMYGIIIAFKDYNAVQGIWGSPWTKNFGFSHFIRFVTAYNFTSLIKNTLVLSLYSLVVNAICPVVLALFVNEIQNKAFKRTVQTISYSPYFISCVVMVGMVVSFLNVDRGIVNKVITSFGGKGTMFMSDPDWFVHLYVWTGVWQGFHSLSRLSFQRRSLSARGCRYRRRFPYEKAVAYKSARDNPRFYYSAYSFRRKYNERGF